jgi:hypothetical protein
MARGIAGILSEQYGAIDKAEPVSAGYRNLKKTECLSIPCLQRVGRNDGLEQ